MITGSSRFISFIVAAFVLALSSHPTAGAASITLPATGNTVCYDQAGTVMNCIGTKQDGALRMGASWPAQRFSDNGDGTFTDSLTGLVWLSDNECVAVAGGTFLEGLDAVANLADGQCGLADGSVKGAWRMPNVNEAGSLFDISKNYLASGILFKTDVYAISTSTTYKKDTGYFLFFYGNGAIAATPKNSLQGSVKAVRNP